MNSINITGRVTSDVAIHYVGASNRPLARFLLVHVRRIGDRERLIELPVLVWGQKAELVVAHLKRGMLTAVSGALDHDYFSMDPEQRASHARSLVIADTVDLYRETAPQAGS